MNFSQILRDIEGWLENSFISLKQDLIFIILWGLSQFMQKCHIDQWNVVILILRYVKENPGQGLSYESKGNTQVLGYCDANYAGYSIDKRSTTGYCVFLGGNLIYWKSKKQSVVSRFSAKVEYTSITLVATCELLWIQFICSRPGAYDLYAPAWGAVFEI